MCEKVAYLKKTLPYLLGDNELMVFKEETCCIFVGTFWYSGQDVTWPTYRLVVCGPNWQVSQEFVEKFIGMM